ncbi:MAG: DUF2726 domain-containing protein [Nitrospirota bacterium]|nr:DUF2726 domain-containing protein [Nitrospirota bacterium]
MTLPLSIESFPVLSQILMLALIIVILVLVYYLMRPWWRQRRQSRLDLRIAIPEFLSVSQRPFIPSSEVVLFNLLHLAARDVFLVFAKIPIRTLVQVGVDDMEARREVVKTLRAVTADYVLVHPGTMLPTKIVMIESVKQDPEQTNLVSILMKMICQEAEIDIIWLNTHRNYSVNELSEVLGLKEDD